MKEKTYEQLLADGDLFDGEDDKADIMNMPEVEREQKLNQRFRKIREFEVTESLKEREARTEPSGVKSGLKFEECDFIIPKSLIINSAFKPLISVLKGAFVRLSANGEYGIAKIIGFRKVAPYELHTKESPMCTIGFDLDTGKKIVEGVQINMVSSSRVSFEEFENFVVNFSIRSLDDLRRKYKRVEAELTRNLTDAELTKTIENRLRDNPKKQSITDKKIEVIRLRDEAIFQKDKATAQHYQKKLEALEDEEREAQKQKDAERRKKRKML